MVGVLLQYEGRPERSSGVNPEAVPSSEEGAASDSAAPAHRQVTYSHTLMTLPALVLLMNNASATSEGEHYLLVSFHLNFCLRFPSSSEQGVLFRAHRSNQ